MHDFRPAVDSLIAIHNGEQGRPPLHHPAPLPPRTIPPTRRTAPAQRDLVTVARHTRVRRALARITRRAA